MRTTKLDTNLLKDFASTAKGGAVSRPTSVTMKGTIVMQGEKIYVKIDGSDNLTPVVTTAQVVDGDRVMVTISNHVATVIGNVTAPAITRAGKMYMQMTEDGLEVGKVNDNDQITGIHVLIADDGYYVVDGNGMVLGHFAGSAIDLGPSGGDFARVRLSGGRGLIDLDNNVLVISGETASGLSQSSSDKKTKAEVVAQLTSIANPRAGIQAIINNVTVASVIASNDGVDITTYGNRKVKVNGYEVLTANQFMLTGTAKSPKATIGAGKNKTVTVTVSVPSGYALAGIREICTNHANLCRLTQFATHPSKNQVGATFVNTGSSAITDFAVSIEWFAFRCQTGSYSGTSTISWSADNEQLLEDEIFDYLEEP